MPKIKSAIKRVEVAERNRHYNRMWKSAIRTAKNNVLELATKGGDAKTTQEALNKAYSVIDKAVSKGVLHTNNAARNKARLTILVRKTAEQKPKK